jgi:DNA-binding transcriptional MerR regulator
MCNLIKIKDISERYGITARTLRYYEDMGLLNSIRNNDYAYRMYDEEAIKRLEQILILRRLSISVKDIKRIFATCGSEVVLEVLSQKAKDIDEEVALLHELKEMVLKFIRQIKQADLSKDSDIKLLYDKASEIENQIVSDENVVDLDRLIEVSDKLKIIHGAAETTAVNCSKEAKAVAEISEAINTSIATPLMQNIEKNRQLAKSLVSELEVTEKTTQLNKLLVEIESAVQEIRNGVFKINNAIGSQLEIGIQSNAATAMELAETHNLMRELLQ